MRKKNRSAWILIGSAVAAGFILSYRPWQVYREQQDATNRLVREMRKSERKQEQLLRQQAQRRTSVGQEEQARESGYLAPGEVPIKP